MKFNTDTIRHAYFQGSNGIGFAVAMRPVYKTVKEQEATLEVSMRSGLTKTQKVWGRIQYICGYAVGMALTSREDQGSRTKGREIAEKRLKAAVDRGDHAGAMVPGSWPTLHRSAPPGEAFFETVEQLADFVDSLRDIEATLDETDAGVERRYRRYLRVFNGNFSHSVLRKADPALSAPATPPPVVLPATGGTWARANPTTVSTAKESLEDLIRRLNGGGLGR